MNEDKNAPKVLTTVPKLRFLCHNQNRKETLFVSTPQETTETYVYDLSPNSLEDVIRYVKKEPGPNPVHSLMTSGVFFCNYNVDTNIFYYSPETPEKVFETAKTYMTREAMFDDLPGNETESTISEDVPDPESRKATDSKSGDFKKIWTSSLRSGKSEEPPVEPLEAPMREDQVRCCKCAYSVALEEADLVCQHYLEQHGEKIFVCPLCPKGMFFYIASSMRQHVAAKHGEEQERACQVVMRKQMLLLTGGTKARKKLLKSRRVKCSLCDLKFPSSEDRDWHKKHQHSTDGHDNHLLHQQHQALTSSINPSTLAAASSSAPSSESPASLKSMVQDAEELQQATTSTTNNAVSGAISQSDHLEKTRRKKTDPAKNLIHRIFYPDRGVEWLCLRCMKLFLEEKLAVEHYPENCKEW